MQTSSSEAKATVTPLVWQDVEFGRLCEAPMPRFPAMSWRVSKPLQPQQRKPPRRPQQELCLLRENVKQLEEQLARLKQQSASTSTTTQSPNTSGTNKDEADPSDLAWRQVASTESMRREQAQCRNLQLHALINSQLQLMYQMNAMVAQRVNWDVALMASFRSNHARQAREGANMDTTTQRRQLQSHRFLQRRSNTQLQRLLLQIARHRMQVFLQRLEVVFQRIDLSFQYQRLVFPSLPEPFDPVHSPISCHRLVFDRDRGTGELVGYTVTCFDVQTMVELLFRCFAYGAKPQVPRIAPTTVTVLPPKSSSTQPNQCENFCDAVERYIMDGIVYGCADVIMVLPHGKTHVQAHGAIGVFNNTLVWESVGTIIATFAVPSTDPANSSLQHRLDFQENVAFRIEELGATDASGQKKQSVIHHVRQIRPLGPNATNKERRKQELELLLGAMQRSHADLSSFFGHLVKNVFLQDENNKFLDHNGSAWPFQGVL